MTAPVDTSAADGDLAELRALVLALRGDLEDAAAANAALAAERDALRAALETLALAQEG